MGRSNPVPLKHTARLSRSAQVKAPPQIPSVELDKDAAIANLIHGLGQLSAQARNLGLGTAARILATAKEDLVYWAVEMNFHESAADRYINAHLYGPDNCTGPSEDK